MAREYAQVTTSQANFNRELHIFVIRLQAAPAPQIAGAEETASKQRQSGIDSIIPEAY
jgi:hypothetical protein